MMLKGKSAIITGSTSGIGKAIAEGLATAGANVMLNGLAKPEDVETDRAALEKATGVKVRFSGANMMKPAEIEEMVGEANEEFGQVDIVVNNAGIQYVAPIEEFPPEKWDAIIAINLSSAFHTCRLTVGDMKKRKWGRVINIASAHGLVASPYKPAYVAAKHGLIGLTKTVALNGAEHGVRVNAICPGYVWTPLVERQIPDTAKARGLTEDQVKRDVLLASQATKEFVTVEQIADLAVFLCSPAGDQITGTALPVDGGWTAQ